ncbi:unnamed protein product [Phytophthora fragariaefolia]|uniref:Unnamed protein product n=1 Tax=Phytophthora fragariaefolia TaxID=1490495 RepID=A0A9W6X7K8_9STRA|nr:unnamed protein product [Phytophthora fragariaefolia]
MLKLARNIIWLPSQDELSNSSQSENVPNEESKSGHDHQKSYPRMATKRGRSPSLHDDAPPAKRSELQQLKDAVAALPAVGHIAAESSVPMADAVEPGGALPEPTDAMTADVLMLEQQSTGSNAAPALVVVAPEFQVVHDSWEAFEEALKAYAKATYQLYVIRSTTSVKRRNLKIAESAAKADSTGSAGALRKVGLELGVPVEHQLEAGEQLVERMLIPERYQWYSKSLKCTHGWKDRHRGTGKRGSGVVRSTSCPAKMCVTLQHRGAGPDDWKVVVTKHVQTHNHQLSKELFLYYTENRRIYDPELLTVVGDAPGVANGAAKPSLDLASAHLTTLIDQANQRGGIFRMLTPSEEQSQQQASSMAFAVSDSSGSASTVLNGNMSDDHSNKQLIELSQATTNNFVIRPRSKTGTPLASMPPLGAMILTPGTIPSRALDGGVFCVPRVTVKVHPTWDAFNDYISQYAFDTAQVFRTRSTVSVAARNAKFLASAAAKAGTDSHDVAGYASYATMSPSSRLIPEEYKWFSKLLICTYGWKRRARGKGSRVGEHNEGGPCPAMLLARVERNVNGQWHIVINRQVPEHNHRLNTQVEETSEDNLSLLEPTANTEVGLTTTPSLSPSTNEPDSSGDSSSLLGAEAITTQMGVEEPQSAISPAQREIVVRVPKLQSVFNSWDDFHANLKAYSDATYQLYRTRTTSSAKGRNKKIARMKRGDFDGENAEHSDNGSDPGTALTGVSVARKIPESWRWYSKTLTCTHGWKERHRGTGKRTAHVVRSTACPVKICATVQYMNSPGRGAAEGSDSTSGNCWRVVVTKHVVDHNHNLSRELYQHYCENRRIYDPELLAIDASNESAVIKRKAFQTPDQHTMSAAVSVQGAQPGGIQTASKQPILPAQMEAGLAEAVAQAQLLASPGDIHPVGVSVSGSTGLQRNLSGMSAISTSASQQVVPSVVLLPYSTTPSYLLGQGQQPPASQQMQLHHHQQAQQSVSVQAAFAATENHLARGGEGVATLAAVASPGLAGANIVLLNQAGITMTNAFPPTGSNVISVACRVHGSSNGTNSTAIAPGQSGLTSSSISSGNQGVESAATGQATQCTCFRIAGGGNYVTIVPATDSPPATDNGFDADENMFYADDTEGAWQPSSNIEIEKVTTESGGTVWRVPRIVRRYPSWEAFHKYLDAYSAATFQLYRVRTTYSVRSRNLRLRQLAASRGLAVREGEGDPNAPVEPEQGVHGLSRAHVVPEEYEWYSKTFLCTHGWKRRSRGSGQRVSHNVRATECPAKVCATLQCTDGASTWSVVVTKHLVEHNHELSEALYQQYSEVRRVRDPEVLAQAEQLWRGGATRRRVFEFLKERSPNHVILMKDVHNLVQRWQAQERRPKQSQQGEDDQDHGELSQQLNQSSPPVVSSSHDVDKMAYFQGGDFVELLSAQGKAPAAAWKLQGKISKTFDKGIRGNAFQLDGSSETKMQLPKAASSSLGLAQRFVVIQLLVPFTRSFSVEICFSDFQKVRRRFVVASAFRETARTTLHVQLPLNAADVPRDQWMNLVFDLQTLSEVHFPDTGYRSMESICIGGSCRLKRIFTMKDAPAPSRGSQVVRHADIRDIPRQFVFSATQRASGLQPIPTMYFAMESGSGVNVHGATVTTNGNSVVSGAIPKSSRRTQTAPNKALTKPQTKGVRATRPGSGQLQHKALIQPQPVNESDKASGPSQQRLRTPTRVKSTESKLRQPQSRIGKVITVQKEHLLLPSEPPSSDIQRSRVPAFEKQQELEVLDYLPRTVPSAEVNEFQEDAVPAETRVEAEKQNSVYDRALSPPHSVYSSLASSPNMEDPQIQEQSRSLRNSILEEIQQKITNLEDEDERADQRDSELFLRHTSLLNGEWHLQQLREDDLMNTNESLLSDEEDDHIQLSSSWRRDLNGVHENAPSPSPEGSLRRSRDDSPHGVKKVIRPADNMDSIFSFSSIRKSGTIEVGKNSSRLFDFGSLLQDLKPLTSSTKDRRPQSDFQTQLEKRIECALSDAEEDGGDLELAKLLAAKRSARELLSQTTEIPYSIDADLVVEQRQSLSTPNKERNGKESVDSARSNSNNSIDYFESEKKAEFMKDSGNPMSTTQFIQAREDQHEYSNPERAQPTGSIIAGDTTLSIDFKLSASGGGSVDDLDEVDDLEGSDGDAHPLDECKPVSDHDSSTLSQQDEEGNESSFDFGDLVEDTGSSDSRDEKEVPCNYDTTVLSNKNVLEVSSFKNYPRQSKYFTTVFSGSPQGNQHLHDIERMSPALTRTVTPEKSPLVISPRRTREKFLEQKSHEQLLKESRSSELMSSFSCYRLQALLESTDWTAELDARANVLCAHSPRSLPFTPNSGRKYDPYRYSSSASSSGVQRSATKVITHGSSKRRSARPQTPSTSSIELVYDPLLRCYYDPVANKYYALAK